MYYFMRHQVRRFLAGERNNASSDFSALSGTKLVRPEVPHQNPDKTSTSVQQKKQTITNQFISLPCTPQWDWFLHVRVIFEHPPTPWWEAGSHWIPSINRTCRKKRPLIFQNEGHSTKHTHELRGPCPAQWDHPKPLIGIRQCFAQTLKSKLLNHVFSCVGCPKIYMLRNIFDLFINVEVNIVKHHWTFWHTIFCPLPFS